MHVLRFILFSVVFLVFSISVGYAQVGIGTTNPNQHAALDINGAEGGLLMPRVALTGTNSPTPLGGHVEGMVVYNTNTNGTGATRVTPGFYYSEGGQWVRFANGGDIKAGWELTGNAIDDTHYLGTNNNFPLRMYANGNERMRITPNGNVGINTGINVDPNFALTVDALNDDEHGVLGSSIDGVGVFGIGGNGAEFLGISTGIVAQSMTQDGVIGITPGNPAGIVGGVSGWAVDEDGFGLFGMNFGVTGTGLLVGKGNLPYFVVSNEGSGASINGDKNALFAVTDKYLATNSNNGNAAGEFLLGSNTHLGGNNTRARAKIAGYDRGVVDPTGSTNSNNYYGGYFEGGAFDISGGESYAYVGVKTNANAQGKNGINYKIIGNGNVSTLVDDNEGNKRVLFAPEAPEILFEDYGVGQLNNGKVYIEIDPLFSKSIHVSEQHPLKVFIQLEGECNGVYVTEKSANGFWVKELNAGTSNVPFSYHLVANRADDIAADGSISSKHVGQRFPIGPKPAKRTEMKKVELDESKVKSKLDRNTQNLKQHLKQKVNSSSLKSRIQSKSTLQEQSNSEVAPSEGQNSLQQQETPRIDHKN